MCELSLSCSFAYRQSRVGGGTCSLIQSRSASSFVRSASSSSADVERGWFFSVEKTTGIRKGAQSSNAIVEINLHLPIVSTKRRPTLSMASEKEPPASGNYYATSDPPALNVSGICGLGDCMLDHSLCGETRISMKQPARRFRKEVGYFWFSDNEYLEGVKKREGSSPGTPSEPPPLPQEIRATRATQIHRRGSRSLPSRHLQDRRRLPVARSQHPRRDQRTSQLMPHRSPRHCHT